MTPMRMSCCPSYMLSNQLRKSEPRLQSVLASFRTYLSSQFEFVRG